MKLLRGLFSLSTVQVILPDKERTKHVKYIFVVDTSCSSVHLGPWVCWLAVTCLVPWSPTRASPLLWSLPSALLGVWLCFWCHVVYIAVNSLHLSPSPCFCCYLHTDRVNEITNWKISRLSAWFALFQSPVPPGHIWNIIFTWLFLGRHGLLELSVRRSLSWCGKGMLSSGSNYPNIS